MYAILIYVAMAEISSEFGAEVWTPERIARFWDIVSSEPRLEKFYFSKAWKNVIVKIAEIGGLEEQEVLDYGCGPGFLSEHLVEKGYVTTALEFSKASVERVNSLIGKHSNWEGCVFSEAFPSPLPSQSFGWIFSIETYEHLPQEWIDGYFREIYRLLKPGGRLFLTTPFAENLDSSLILCPCCETRFHRWGHLRSTTEDEMNEVATSNGFTIEYCQGVSFEAFEDPNYLAYPESFFDWGSYVVKRFLYRLFRSNLKLRHTLGCQFNLDNLPHGENLVLIASKPNSEG